MVLQVNKMLLLRILKINMNSSGGVVSQLMSKHVQVGEWIFEIKMVRALKVEEYGKPYSAIANCNINGDSMYIDGLLIKDGQNFTKSDFNSFNDFCEQIGLKQCSYHRYQNGESKTKEVMITSSTKTETKTETLTINSDSFIHLVK